MQKGRAFTLWILVLFIQLTASGKACAKSDSLERYPEEIWMQYQTPEQAGFIKSRLGKVKKFYDKRDFAALLVIKGGAIALDWGENERRFPIHSIRKSLLSGLYGIHADELDLHMSLADMRVNDNPMLTEQELSATLLDVLSSRSGVYLPAAAESVQMTQDKPIRGSHPPGRFWWYNNWDFNVASTVYTQLTGEEIFQSFSTHFSLPLQMQDYRIFDGYYVKSNSVHAAPQMSMSSRDLARLGLLFARDGVWRGKAILSPEWITASTSALSETNLGDNYPPNYGLMWWVEKNGSFSARGNGGHVLAVYPKQDLVVVLRVNTYLEQSVSARAIKKILSGIVSAASGTAKSNPDLVPASQSISHAKSLPEQYRFDQASIKLASGDAISLRTRGNKLFLELDTGELELSYVSNGRFTIVDRQEPVQIELDADGNITEIKTPRIFYIQATHAAQQGDLNGALTWLEQAVEFTPHSAIPRINQAKVLIAQERFNEARDALAVALNIEPNNKLANKLDNHLMMRQWRMPTLLVVVVILLFVLVKLRSKYRR